MDRKQGVATVLYSEDKACCVRVIYSALHVNVRRSDIDCTRLDVTTTVPRSQLANRSPRRPLRDLSVARANKETREYTEDYIMYHAEYSQTITEL